MESLIPLKGKKGQMSIEFMMLVILILVYINAVVQPTMIEAEISLRDTTRVAQGRAAAQKLTNSIDFVSSCDSQTKETITLFIPKDANIYCNDSLDIPANVIDFNIAVQGDYILQGSLGECLDFYCYGRINVNQDAIIDCSGLGEGVIGPEQGMKAQRITVFKNDAGVVNVS